MTVDRIKKGGYKVIKKEGGRVFMGKGSTPQCVVDEKGEVRHL